MNALGGTAVPCIHRGFSRSGTGVLDSAHSTFVVAAKDFSKR